MNHPTRRLDPSHEDATPEHATQRLTPAAPKPDGRPCLRCSSPMVKAWVRPTPNNTIGTNYTATLNLDRPTRNRGLFGHRNSSTRCDAWVCPDCGYTELVAVNPRVLLES